MYEYEHALPLLKTGDKFIATDKLGRSYLYVFLGIDLSDLAEGAGCRSVILRNITTDTLTRVETAWFSQRHITRCKGEETT